MDRRKRSRQLEQSGHKCLRPRPRQTGRWDFPLSTGPDCLERTCPGYTPEGNPRRNPGLRIRAVAEKSGTSLLHRFRAKADCGELDQVDPRPDRDRKYPAEIRAATSTTFASVAIFLPRKFGVFERVSSRQQRAFQEQPYFISNRSEK